jgi:hypothetical protein
MRIMRLVDEYKALSAESHALASEVTDAEHEARVDLASSASQFSRSARQVLDDKLSFSATLMRAGEPDAAKRLLAEVAQDVAQEEAALVEQVNEVRLAQAVRRQRLTRARALKSLIAAMVGSSVMLMSAMGFAVASMFDDDSTPTVDLAQGSSLDGSPTINREVRVLTVGGVKLRLTNQEFKLFQKLTTGEIDALKLQAFLQEVVPDPSLVSRITAAIAELTDGVLPVTQGVVPLVTDAAHDAHSEAQSSSSETKEGSPTSSDDHEADGEPKDKSDGQETGGPASGLPEPNDLLDANDDGKLLN